MRGWYLSDLKNLMEIRSDTSIPGIIDYMMRESLDGKHPINMKEIINGSLTSAYQWALTTLGDRKDNLMIEKS